MILIKNKAQIEAMRQGGRILALILDELCKRVVPGTRTKELDDLARRLCLKYHVQPSFLDYNGYPAAVCISLNNEVVHGLPGERVIEKGDLVSIDMGVICANMNTDAARTVIAGEAKNTIDEQLVKVCEQSFYSGCDLIKEGVRLGDVSAKIQETAEKNGFGVVRMLVGHGIGEKLHEEPPIPNYGQKGDGPVLKAGMTLAIEPMLTEGEWEVFLDNDKWTYKTVDGGKASHFEHTVLVTKEGFEILTEL